jgi:uncharacterized iron-regulated membrane protein
MTPRRILLNVHLCLGLVAAPLLAVVGLSGAVIAFEQPLDHLLDADLVRARGSGPALSLAELERRVEAAHPRYRTVSVGIPEGSRDAWNLGLEADSGAGLDLFVNPGDGAVLGTADQASTLLQTVHQLHTRLLAGETGKAIVGWSGVVLVVLALSGLVLWWPGKILRLRRGGPARRMALDLHHAIGGLSWLFLLILGLTGTVVYWDRGAMRLAARITGEALPGPFPHAPGKCEGEAALPLGQLVAAAAAAVPDARVTAAMLTPGGAPARVIMKYPEDRTPAGRTNVFVASCSGEILEARRSRTAPAAYRAVAMWNREIHTGDLWGWPTRILAALVSLTLPVSALTGPIIWWTRRRDPSRSRAL